jgi:hypothetical protein
MREPFKLINKIQEMSYKLIWYGINKKLFCKSSRIMELIITHIQSEKDFQMGYNTETNLSTILDATRGYAICFILL